MFKPLLLNSQIRRRGGHYEGSITTKEIEGGFFTEYQTADNSSISFLIYTPLILSKGKKQWNTPTAFTFIDETTREWKTDNIPATETITATAYGINEMPTTRASEDRENSTISAFGAMSDTDEINTHVGYFEEGTNPVTGMGHAYKAIFSRASKPIYEGTGEEIGSCEIVIEKGENEINYKIQNLPENNYKYISVQFVKTFTYEELNAAQFPPILASYADGNILTVNSYIKIGTYNAIDLYYTTGTRSGYTIPYLAPYKNSISLASLYPGYKIKAGGN